MYTNTHTHHTLTHTQGQRERGRERPTRNRYKLLIFSSFFCNLFIFICKKKRKKSFFFQDDFLFVFIGVYAKVYKQNIMFNAIGKSRTKTKFGISLKIIQTEIVHSLNPCLMNFFFLFARFCALFANG